MYFAISAMYCLTVGSFANVGDAGSFRYCALIEPLTRSALELRNEAEAQKLPLDQIDAQALALEADVAKTALPPWKDDEELWRLRKQYLQRQMSALRGRVAELLGELLVQR